MPRNLIPTRFGLPLFWILCWPISEVLAGPIMTAASGTAGQGGDGSSEETRSGLTAHLLTTVGQEMHDESLPVRVWSNGAGGLVPQGLTDLSSGTGTVGAAARSGAWASGRGASTSMAVNRSPVAPSPMSTRAGALERSPERPTPSGDTVSPAVPNLSMPPNVNRGSGSASTNPVSAQRSSASSPDFRAMGTTGPATVGPSMAATSNGGASNLNSGSSSSGSTTSSAISNSSISSLGINHVLGNRQFIDIELGINHVLGNRQFINTSNFRRDNGLNEREHGGAGNLASRNDPVPCRSGCRGAGDRIIPHDQHRFTQSTVWPLLDERGALAGSRSDHWGADDRLRNLERSSTDRLGHASGFEYDGPARRGIRGSGCRAIWASVGSLGKRHRERRDLTG